MKELCKFRDEGVAGEGQGVAGEDEETAGEDIVDVDAYDDISTDIDVKGVRIIAFLQSAWTMRRSSAAQMAKSERTESILMTGANV